MIAKRLEDYLDRLQEEYPQLSREQIKKICTRSCGGIMQALKQNENVQIRAPRNGNNRLTIFRYNNVPVYEQPKDTDSSGRTE